MQQHSLGLAALLVVGTAFLGAIPQDASAQQLRVIADGTQVRFAPDPDSPVVATLGAGTILEQVVSDGPYAGVLLMTDEEEQLVGYILSSAVEVLYDSPTAQVPPPSTTIGDPGPGPLRATLEQAQYAEADAMRSSGKSKIYVGLALAGTSWAAVQFLPFLSVPDRDNYLRDSEYQNALDRRANAETGQKVGVGLGLAVAVYGIGQVIRASRTRADIDLEARRAAAPGVELRYTIARQQISSGRKKLLWGVVLAGTSYAVVKWTPYLAVPDAADHNDQVSYQVAADRRTNAERVRNGAMVLSGALGAWGMYQWRAGSREMAAIDAEVGARSAALDLPVTTAHSDVAVGLFAGPVGRRTAVGLRLVW